MSEKIKIGSPVLFYGRNMVVTELPDGPVSVAKAVEAGTAEATANARLELAQLRAEQLNPATSTTRYQELADRVAVIDRELSLAHFSVSLRVDLLTWWAERKVWISEGRVLSDLQRGVLKLMNMPVTPDNHRHLLTFLDGVPAAERRRYEAAVAAAEAEAAKARGQNAA